MTWFLLTLSVATNIILITQVRHCRTVKAERAGWRSLAITSRRRALAAEHRAHVAEQLLAEDLMDEADHLTGGDR